MSKKNRYLDMAERLNVIKRDFEHRLELNRKAQNKTVLGIRRLKNAIRRAHEIADAHGILLRQDLHQSSLSTLSPPEQKEKSDRRERILELIGRSARELTGLRDAFLNCSQESRQIKKNLSWLNQTLSKF